MTDLYLREAQFLVMKAQIQVLDQIRRGVTIQVLEGRSLDEIPTQACWETATDFAKRGLGPDAAPVAEGAVEALEKAVVCYKDSDGSIKIRPTATMRSADRAREFMEPHMNEQDLLDEAQREFSEKGEDLAKMTEDTDGISISSLDTEDSKADPARKDMELYTTFVMVSKGSGKVHKPGMEPGV